MFLFILFRSSIYLFVSCLDWEILSKISYLIQVVYFCCDHPVETGWTLTPHTQTQTCAQRLRLVIPHTCTKYKKVCFPHNEVFLREQDRIPSRSKKVLRESQERRLAWFLIWLGDGTGVRTPTGMSWGLNNLSFPSAPKEEAPGFLISLSRYGTEVERGMRDLKTVRIKCKNEVKHIITISH